MGHVRKDCNQRAVSMFCTICDSRIHTKDTCPSIWRSYVVLKNRKEKYPSSVYCYNCGAEGHYGDDCVEPRRIELRFVEDSAFNGNFLPSNMRSRYYKEISRLKHEHERARNRALEDSISRKDRRAMNREREKDYKRTNRNNRNSLPYDNGNSYFYNRRDNKPRGGSDYYRNVPTGPRRRM